jgi:hypothetical protein
MSKKQVFSERGQGLVELALMFPIMVLFLLVIVDVGRVAYYYSAVHNAAREGARFAVVHWGDPMRTVHTIEAVERLTAGLHADEISVSVQFTDSPSDEDSTEDTVLVIVNYQFTAATPILARLIGPDVDTIDMSSRAHMRLER